MRNVAVTEGDKVEAQIKFGWEIDAYPVNEIAEAVNAVSKGDSTPWWKSITASMRFCWKAGIRKNSAPCGGAGTDRDRI